MVFGCLKFESEICEAHERATLTTVIARLDRATQDSGLSEIHTDAGAYWVPAFAGMTTRAAAASPTALRPPATGAGPGARATACWRGGGRRRSRRWRRVRRDGRHSGRR